MSCGTSEFLTANHNIYTPRVEQHTFVTTQNFREVITEFGCILFELEEVYLIACV